MKKQYILICSFILAFSFFIIIYLKPNSYELKYKVNDINIKEIYNDKDKYYLFNIYYKDLNFELISFDKYISKRKLIEDISFTEEDDAICTNIISSKVTLYNICYANNYKISTITNDIIFNEYDKYENISINDLNNKKYLLWNYHDFIYIDNNKKNKINLFNKDIYNINLNYVYNNYLLIPDYEEEYVFNKMYYLNIDNLKKEYINLRFPLYFDSYFLGNYKNNIYLYDIKNEQEYFINLKKQDIYKTSNKVLNDNKWEKVSTQKLKNNKLSFINSNVINYTIDNKTLYMSINNSDIKLQVSNFEVNKIIKTDNLDVYYVSGDVLYYFNPLKGTKALLKYSEWLFNYKNMIFIFD